MVKNTKCMHISTGYNKFMVEKSLQKWAGNGNQLVLPFYPSIQFLHSVSGYLQHPCALRVPVWDSEHVIVGFFHFDLSCLAKPLYPGRVGPQLCGQTLQPSAAMVQGQVLFKAGQISWKKEQKLRFFPWIKNNRIFFHRIFVLIWKLVFKIREGNLIFVVLLFCEVLFTNYIMSQWWLHFLFILHCKYIPISNTNFCILRSILFKIQDFFLKKEQNLYFKELKEHFWKKGVLYQTIKTKERLYHSCI